MFADHNYKEFAVQTLSNTFEQEITDCLEQFGITPHFIEHRIARFINDLKMNSDNRKFFIGSTFAMPPNIDHVGLFLPVLGKGSLIHQARRECVAHIAQLPYANYLWDDLAAEITFWEEGKRKPLFKTYLPPLEQAAEEAGVELVQQQPYNKLRLSIDHYQIWFSEVYNRKPRPEEYPVGMQTIVASTLTSFIQFYNSTRGRVEMNPPLPFPVPTNDELKAAAEYLEQQGDELQTTYCDTFYYESSTNLLSIIELEGETPETLGALVRVYYKLAEVLRDKPKKQQIFLELADDFRLKLELQKTYKVYGFGNNTYLDQAGMDLPLQLA